MDIVWKGERKSVSIEKCLLLFKRFDKDQDLVLELFALVDELRQLVAQLPSQNRDTLRFLILHLHRMTWFELDNLMTAANIGAVISPSLMWSTTTSASNSPNIANSSTALAVDTSFMSDAHAQSRTIELLIKYAYVSDGLLLLPTSRMYQWSFSRLNSNSIVCIWM
jgi:hypothetical protein